MDEEDWREEVEYALSTIRIGTTLTFEIRQMEELSLAASLSMLTEMTETTSEISGQRIWPGSYLLAEFVHEHPELVANKRVLELGAGTGLVSLVANLAGTRAAIATDGDMSVVTDILEWNVQHNAPPSSTIDTASLWWGDNSSSGEFRRRFGDELFDIVVAGDVLYKGELVPLLLTTVKEWLHPEGIFVLCHIPRADVSHEVLQRELTSHGFKWTLLQEAAQAGRLPEDCSMDDVKKAKVYRIEIFHQ
ncbi:unnamed protein product [Aphanomyces euteiches]|uniref:FAM86 N-terminal domain-containing protein n=1 Tax=Aphanomyces euteiches TaxID=100861 RepID=A0A6G0WHQ3_9STRA|nr:hypothetical protein Ae201684_015092 [Aphanomyces euteiches]KAH9063138.1 hypothetical protein Ae201684P_009401 [Aphanomyces euteiches]KAH9133678.1 hypothetical protein AeRB84_020271 [Aphanomyces euteiches]